MRSGGIVEKSLPTAIAVAANACAIGILSLISINVSSGPSESMSVVLGDSLGVAEASEPPSVVATAANQVALQRAAQKMLTASPIPPIVGDLSAVTTMVAVPRIFELKVSLPIGPPSARLTAMKEGIVEPSTAATSVTPSSAVGGGSAGKNPNDSGQDKGLGNGTANGVKIIKHPRNANVAGNVGDGWQFAPGRDSLKNQRIVLLQDVSESMAMNDRPLVVRHIVSENHVVGKISFYWTVMGSQPKNSAVVKELAEKNDFTVWQDAFDAWSGLPRTTREGERAEIGNIYYGILAACEKYAGQNALLVVVSDFNELDSRMEDVPFLVEKLTKAGLRLYLVKLTGGLYMRGYSSPNSPSGYVTAVMSGGGARNVDIREIGKGGPIEFENPYR